MKSPTQFQLTVSNSLALLLVLPTSTFATCYTLTSPTNQLLYQSPSPPFDLSAPPPSPSALASRSRGEKLLITSTCPSSESDLGKESDLLIRTQIRKQQILESDLARRSERDHQIRVELDRRLDLNLKKLKLWNDLAR